VRLWYNDGKAAVFVNSHQSVHSQGGLVALVALLAWCVQVFWNRHNPTQLNRQGNDVGTQYRGGVYYFDEEQRRAVEASRDRLQVRRHNGQGQGEVEGGGGHPALVSYGLQTGASIRAVKHWSIGMAL
jgi:hypothetical protein